MVKVFDVYSVKEDGFTVIISDQGTHTRIYETSSGSIAHILRAAGIEFERGQSLPLYRYRRIYKFN